MHIPLSQLHSIENSKQQEARKNMDLIRKRAFRERESSDQRNKRLAYQQKRSASTRSRESRQERSKRLIDQRKRSAVNRLSKSKQGKMPRQIFNQQWSEITESIDESQQTIEKNQVMKERHQLQALAKNRQILLDQYRWPAAIPTPLKEYCLEDFCNHTSMSALRQSVCIICNVRASVSTMKEYDLQDIPNLEKLSSHADMMDLISKITSQTAQSENFYCRIIFINMQRLFFFIDNETCSIFCSFSNAVLYKKGYNKLTKSGKICQECNSALVKNKVPMCSVANKMWIGDVPPILQQLTIAEEKL